MTARWFRSFTVAHDLDHVLACRYLATAAGHHDLIPDGCVDLFALTDGSVVLCGPDTHSWSFELRPGTEIAGVRFRPGAAAGVFRVGADSLLDRRVALDQLVPARTARRLAERLVDAEPRRRLDLLEDMARTLAGPDEHDPDGTVALAGVVASGRGPQVDDLAAATGVSSRQLRRRFDRRVGYGPAFFARITRLQRFARAAGRDPNASIATLAADAGYADQAHLARDCRAIAGVTPRQLVGLVPRSSVVTSLVDVRFVQDDEVAAA